MFRFNPHAWSLTTNSQCTPATILNPICSCANSVYFFFNDTATTEIYTLSLHDALPICLPVVVMIPRAVRSAQMALTPSPPSTRPAASRTISASPGIWVTPSVAKPNARAAGAAGRSARSEEHTSELQSRQYLVCRLLLEKKKNRSLFTAMETAEIGIGHLTKCAVVPVLSHMPKDFRRSRLKNGSR